MASIDKYLNRYATEKADYKHEWWFNGDHVIAAAIASAAKHVRKDGHHALADGERAELKTLERYMKYYTDPDQALTTVEQDMWLHVESMWLLTKWFSRLWD